jgi:thymidylate kinase
MENKISYPKTHLMIWTLAFSGPDGTGKTSCANILSKILSSKNYRVIRVWIKTSHVLALLIVRLLEKIDLKHIIKSTSGTLVTNTLIKNTNLWMWIELSGILMKILIMRITLIILRFISRRPTIAIADRFLLDSIVHITISKILLEQENPMPRKIFVLLTHPVCKILRSILLRYSFTIYLDGEVTELIQRNSKAKKADPYWYMILQKYLYRITVKALDIHHLYIDTSKKTLKEVFMEVLAGLNREKVIRY